MILSPAGCIVAQELIKTGHVRKNVTIESWVVMPNHVHAIIAINEPVETPRRGVSTENLWRTGTLGAIINQFKSVCTKRIRKMGITDFAWQARFHDHIIRNEKSLKSIHAYITANPSKWPTDEYFLMAGFNKVD